ncbi:cell division topological specificity factor MinE [bacterium]|nr:cell division topological specificity factor MinE [bacterium]
MFRALATKIFGGSSESKALAKSRLHFVLVQDRTGLSNEQMAQFRGELVEVIQRYFDIDERGFDISYEREDESTTLVINSPVVVRRKGAQPHKEKMAHKEKMEQKEKAAEPEKATAVGAERSASRSMSSSSGRNTNGAGNRRKRGGRRKHVS